MRKLVALLLFVNIVVIASAQKYSIYQNLTTSNGLPSNYIFAVCEDDNGFLWAGTDKGLCRFNGFSWQVWDKDNGLPGNYVSEIYADKRGGLIINISEKGFFSFDVATGKVQPLSYKALKIDNNGNIYYTQRSSTKNLFETFLLPAGKLTRPTMVFEHDGNELYHIFPDAKTKQLICVGKSRSPFQVNIQINNLWRVTTRTIPDYYHKIYFANDSVIVTNCFYYKFNNRGELLFSQRLFADDNSYANTSASSTGYYVTDIKTGYFHILNNGEKKFYGISSGLRSDYVNSIYEMHDGTVVFSTLGAGLQLKKHDYRKSFLTENRVVRSIVKSGAFWYVLAGEKVFKIHETTLVFDELGNVANSALHLFNAGDQLLVGSLRGISFYNINKPLQQSHFIPLNAGVSSILRQGKHFIASTYGTGLISFEDRSARAAVLTTPMRIVEKIIPYSGGIAHLSYEDGLMLTDNNGSTRRRITQKDGLLSNSIQNIYESNDTLWIATKAGLNIFTNGNVVGTLSFDEGFKGTKVVYTFHDHKRQLWVLSDKYLHLLTGKKLKALTSHPLVSENDDIINTAHYDSTTRVLATGSSKNISFVYLDNIVANPVVSKPRLLTTLVDGSVANLPGFKVPYHFKNIQFRFAPFAASPLSKSTLYFKLDGSEDAWHELKDSLSFSYTALRPGNYNLKAKIVNADGYESSEASLAQFTVSRPFWFRAWFIILLIAFIVLITTLVVRQFEITRRKKKDAELRIQQTLQHERERISKDLHDHLGSNLVTIVAQVDNIENKIDKKDFSEVSARVQNLSSQTREVMNVLRETIWAVQEDEHTLESFIIRIRTFLQRLYESTNVTWNLKVSDGHEIKLSPTQTLHLFRIIQEASQNIIKHSKATEVSYSFNSSIQTLQIIVSDNGIGLSGIQDSQTSNGFANMRQRVNELAGEISIGNDLGTKIKVEIPL